MADRIEGHPHPDYICIAPHTYGWGDTPEQAKRNCRAAGGSFKEQGYIVYNVPEGTEVSTFNGSLSWPKDKGDPVVVQDTRKPGHRPIR